MRIAITGTIGSGKSTVMAMIKELGYPVLSCDAIAHQLQQEGEKGYSAISKAFPEVVEKNQINRTKLGEIVFNDVSQLAQLNTIMLPLIKEELIKSMNQYSLVFVEVPLLFETDFYQLFDKSILIYASEERVIERLKERGLTLEAIKKRIASQMCLADKLKLADYAIANNRDLATLKDELSRIIKEVEKC